MRLKDVQAGMDRVVTEARMARTAVEFLNDALSTDPSLEFTIGLDRQMIRECRKNLEHTYVVRLFAVFEWNLREIWARAFHRKTHPKMTDLINAVAAARKFVDQRMIQNAHRVREYRNSMVHVGTEKVAVLTLAEAAHYLKAFLSEMPREW